MDYKVGCSLSYRVTTPTPFVFNIEAARTGGQSVTSETLDLSPGVAVERWTMPESGNRYLRVMVEPGPFKLDYTAEVAIHPVLEAPDSVTEILASGPAAVGPAASLAQPATCQSDQLNRLAQRTFGGETPGYARVNAVCNWIHDNVDYMGGISDAMTSAFDTATQRAGVCRDFAHLAIALCRSLGIPTRYVSAYAHRLQPPDFHAVIEAFLQGPQGPGWYLFDPTRKSGTRRVSCGSASAATPPRWPSRVPSATSNTTSPRCGSKRRAAPIRASPPRRCGPSRRRQTGAQG